MTQQLPCPPRHLPPHQCVAKEPPPDPEEEQINKHVLPGLNLEPNLVPTLSRGSQLLQELKLCEVWWLARRKESHCCPAMFGFYQPEKALPETLPHDTNHRKPGFAGFHCLWNKLCYLYPGILGALVSVLRLVPG